MKEQIGPAPLTWNRLIDLRKKLEAGWDRDTAFKGGEKGSSKAQCFPTSRVGFVLLEEFHPKLVHGVWEGMNHYWLEIDGNIVDLSADQVEGYPSVVWGTYEEYPAYEPLTRKTSFKSRDTDGERRVAILLSRVQS